MRGVKKKAARRQTGPLILSRLTGAGAESQSDDNCTCTSFSCQECTGAPQTVGLDNGHISARQQLSQSLRHIKDRLSDAVVTVRPNGLGVHRKRKVAAVGGQRGGGQRGKIYGRSQQSNRRLMDYLSRIELDDVVAVDPRQLHTQAIFNTLTYPKEYPPDNAQVKRDLRTWQKRLERAYNVKWVLWFEEFQKRGAPHFHLVMVFDKKVNLSAFRAWSATNWYEVVGSGDKKHLKRGAHVVALHTRRGVGTLMSYLAKEIGLGRKKSYQMRSVDRETGELLSTGRTWGFWHKENVPFAVYGVFLITGLADWQEFKERIAQHFTKSRYLQSVGDMKWWGGALLYGDGRKLARQLLPGLGVKELARGIP